MEEDDAEDDSTDGTDARPDSVGGTYRDGLDGLREQHHAEGVEEGEADEPAHEGVSCGTVHLAEAEGKGHLAQSRTDQNYPVHSLYDDPTEGCSNVRRLLPRKQGAKIKIIFY